MQTKTRSALESLLNVAIGYLVAVGSQIIIFPLFDIHIPLTDNFIIGFYFTVISIIRSYTLRRWFNRKDFKEIIEQAMKEDYKRYIN